MSKTAINYGINKLGKNNGVLLRWIPTLKSHNGNIKLTLLQTLDKSAITRV